MPASAIAATRFAAPTAFKNLLIRVSARLASDAGVLPSASGTPPLGSMRANRIPATLAASPVAATAPTAASAACRADRILRETADPHCDARGDVAAVED
jgi:hypothetical protein